MENQKQLKWYQKPTGVIILLLFFFPVGLYLMWKNELWTKKTRWIVTGILALMIAINSGNNNSGIANSSSNNSSGSSNGVSEEISKRVYRQGYSDGQTGYGLPASQRVTADQFYLARGYNFSTADYYVYKMGYNDGVYGRAKKY